MPFYLHDRRHFGPLEAADRLLVFNQLLPHLGLALIVMMAALAVALSFTRMNAAVLFRNCALVQAFPVVAGVVLLTVQNRQLNLWYARYGPFFAWFVLMALACESSLNRDWRTQQGQGWREAAMCEDDPRRGDPRRDATP